MAESEGSSARASRAYRRPGPPKHQAYATGVYPKYLLSGLLQCGMRGSNLIVSGPAQGYVCATRVNGGLHACSNRLRLPRVRLARTPAAELGS
jgi:hypothetical protein